MNRSHQRESIDVALAAGDVPSAARLAADAVAAGNTEPILLNLAAWMREEFADFDGARRLLNQALRIAPADPTILTALGRLERRCGNDPAAFRWFDAASAVDPVFAVPWLERGFAYDAAGNNAAARSAYLRAAALDPGLAEAWAGAAAIATREGDAASVRDLSERTFAIDRSNVVANCAMAASQIENGAPELAVSRLIAVLSGDEPTSEECIAALTLLGEAYDKIGQPADAFSAWSDAKAKFAAFHAPRFGRHEPQRSFIERLTTRLRDTDTMRWRRPVAPAGHGPAAGHVFLLGYPRSGTTLVENILAGAPGVDALEELPTLVDSDPYLIDDDGLERLLAADDIEVSRLRDAYWARVSSLGIDPIGKIVVDMNPMNGIKLPVIARLFPNAAIVVMRRDPRDVVLSCFRQNFRIGALALAFTTIEESARHYCATMTLTELCLAMMPVAHHVVRYDALVADFDRTTQALCIFTGVGWSSELRRFDRVARARGVTTASSTQVRRGLFDGGGRWLRYRAELAPILPILTPWVEQFGFDLSDVPLEKLSRLE